MILDVKLDDLDERLTWKKTLAFEEKILDALWPLDDIDYGDVVGTWEWTLREIASCNMDSLALTNVHVLEGEKYSWCSLVPEVLIVNPDDESDFMYIEDGPEGFENFVTGILLEEIDQDTEVIRSLHIAKVWFSFGLRVTDVQFYHIGNRADFFKYDRKLAKLENRIKEHLIGMRENT